MVYVVKKEGKRYVVRHRYTQVSKGTRTSHAEAQRLANDLNRYGQQVSAAYARIVGATEGQGI